MKMKSLSLVAVALAAVLAPSAHAGMAPKLEISPSVQTVNFGNQAVVDIFATGLGNGSAPAIAGFDFTLFFDSSILSPVSVAFSSRLGDPNNSSESLNFNQYVLAGPTVIGIQLQNLSLLDGTTLFALQTAGSSGFSLATITFDTIATGTSALSFFVGSSSDESYNDLNLTGGTGSIDVTTGGGSAVPEPATYVMSGVGLLAAGLARRLRKK